MHRIIILFAFVMTISISCQTLRNLGKTNAGLTQKQVVKKMIENDKKLESLSAKFSIETNLIDQKPNGSIRMKQDSIVWISISALLNIEVARLKATRDSAVIINKLNGTYCKTDVYELSKKFGNNDLYSLIECFLVNSLPEILQNDLTNNKNVESDFDSLQYLYKLNSAPYNWICSVRSDIFKSCAAYFRLLL